MLHQNTSLNVKSIFQGPYDKNPQSLIIWNCKCTQNIHYTGSSGCRDSFNQHVHSFPGFCSLRQLLHLSMNTPPLLLHCSKLFICQPADFYKKNHWQGWEIFEIRFTMQATWVVLFVLSCETIVSIVKLFAVQVLWGGGVGPYLQSIFSTRYAHIRNPVLLKPCVQWTPSGEKAAQWSKTENLHLYFNLKHFAQHS